MSIHMSLRGDGRTRVDCATYPDNAPILTMGSYPGGHLSVYVGNRGHLTDGDVEFARALAAAAEAFRIECERLHAATEQAPGQLHLAPVASAS